MVELIDSYGRKIDYLRISIIDRCDLRCIYCMPESGIKLLPREKILSYEEILSFSEVAIRQGIKKIKITGGEPLIRKDVISFIGKMAHLSGLEDFSLTTNGTLLADYAVDLFRVGLKRVNIGIDSLDPEIFQKVTRGGDVKQVLAGIKKVVEVGFSPVKLNVVVLKGINEDLRPFVKLTYEYPIYVRFIEYMPVTNRLGGDFFVPCSVIKEQLHRLGEMEEAEAPLGFGPAKEYYKFKGALGSVSLICALTNHFCSQCNRLRLTADGKLRLCLFSDKEIDVVRTLRPQPNQKEIEKILKKAVLKKPKEYKLMGRGNNGRTMCQIGG